MLSQQTVVEDYLSQTVERVQENGAGEGKRKEGGKKDARKEEWMNHFRNGTLKTVKPLNNLADAADVCVRMCARLCCLFVL